MAARAAVPLALAVILLGNVPGLGVGRVLDEVGLSQRWGVFAPDPASRRIDLSARVTFADGSHAVWRPPHHGVLGATLDYHWEMWAARVVRDDDSELWAPAASWIARHGAWGGRRVVRVTLRRRWVDLAAPGSAATPPVQEFAFYTREFPLGSGR
jgi:hypothetical protein